MCLEHCSLISVEWYSFLCRPTVWQKFPDIVVKHLEWLGLTSKENPFGFFTLWLSQGRGFLWSIYALDLSEFPGICQKGPRRTSLGSQPLVRCGLSRAQGGFHLVPNGMPLAKFDWASKSALLLTSFHPRDPAATVTFSNCGKIHVK